MNIPFPFAIGDIVKLKLTGETGTVRSLCQHFHGNQQAYIAYKAGDGRAVEAWWDADQIESA